MVGGAVPHDRLPGRARQGRLSKWRVLHRYPRPSGPLAIRGCSARHRDWPPPGWRSPRAGVAQLARASACHAEGRGFESHHPLHSLLFVHIGSLCSLAWQGRWGHGFGRRYDRLTRRGRLCPAVGVNRGRPTCGRGMSPMGCQVGGLLAGHRVGCLRPCYRSGGAGAALAAGQEALVAPLPSARMRWWRACHRSGGAGGAFRWLARVVGRIAGLWASLPIATSRLSARMSLIEQASRASGTDVVPSLNRRSGSRAAGLDRRQAAMVGMVADRPPDGGGKPLLAARVSVSFVLTLGKRATIVEGQPVARPYNGNT